MHPELIGYLVAGCSVVAAAAFFIGRLTGSGAARRRALESQLASAHDELSRFALEVEELRDQLHAAREEHAAYRLSVVEHFSGTSELLRDLTVQYRSVYEHLTKGASTLCPEGFVGLTEGLPIPALAESKPKTEPESEPETSRSAPPAKASDSALPSLKERGFDEDTRPLSP